MSFSIKKLERPELIELRKNIVPIVYNQYRTYSGRDLITSDHDNLRNRRKDLFQLNLGIFDGTKLVGWSDGFQLMDVIYYMRDSGIHPDYRRKGLYSMLLKEVLKETQKAGFLELESRHNMDNNPIIIAKLKEGFFISGTEQSPFYGPTVKLSYFHHSKVKSADNFSCAICYYFSYSYPKFLFTSRFQIIKSS